MKRLKVLSGTYKKESFARRLLGELPHSWLCTHLKTCFSSGVYCALSFFSRLLFSRLVFASRTNRACHRTAVSLFPYCLATDPACNSNRAKFVGDADDIVNRSATPSSIVLGFFPLPIDSSFSRVFFSRVIASPRGDDEKVITCNF